MKSSINDIVFGMYPSSTQLVRTLQALCPPQIPASLHFILVSIAEIIFHFHVIHEQLHLRYCVWNVSLLDPVRKVFIAIIPSPILAFLDFILASIIHFHGSHE